MDTRNRRGTIREAAVENCVHPDTIRRRIAKGELRAYRLGSRIIRVDLDEVSALFHEIPTSNNSAA